ncbi:cytochrome P450 [Planobispora longispora]|uniref:Cytochrome P450 n=1 Tax=Planobispora longispora TaxID=28887 RepID=A0A8J3RNH2_9ACTN|nr:cytochrome P450 [Planobispora longispora]GIH78194.1 cytochrome P450 [Planobispora longispora]
MSYHPTGTARFQAGASPNRLWLWLLARTGDPLARLLEPGFCGDAYGLYEQMRAQEPVYRSRTGMLAVLSYDRCSRVLHDPRFLAWGSSARPAGRRAPTPGETPAAVGPFEARTQENDHACTIAASLVKPALQPSVSRVEVTAHNLLSRAADGDAFDLIDDFALPLVTACLSEVLGIPHGDSARFADLCAVMGRSIGGRPSARQAEELHDANEDLEALLIRLQRERRKHPGGDLISRLTAARRGRTPEHDPDRLLGHARQWERRENPDAGTTGWPSTAPARLNLEEIVEACKELIVSGLDTAVDLIGNAVAALAAYPDQWQMLKAAPQLADKAAEETLRFDPPRQFILRIASERIELAGHTVPSGSRVLVMLAAAHRDPDQFPDPARFDITRTSGPRHLAVSGAMGLESSLARLTGEIALRTLASRLPELRMAGQAVRRPGGAVRGFIHLPLRARAAPMGC